MEHYETYETILEVLLVILCIVTSAFPLYYGTRNKWWVTRAGKSILFLSTCLAGAWDLTAFLHFFPKFYPFQAEEHITALFISQFIVMLLTIGAGVYLLYALWYNRRHGQMVTVPKEKEDPTR